MKNLIILFLFVFLLSGSIQLSLSNISNNKYHPSSIVIMDTQQYFIHQQLSIKNLGENNPEKQNLWVALIHDISPYQKVVSREITPSIYILVNDEYNNQYAEFDFSNHPPKTVVNVDIEYIVNVNELGFDLTDCEGELLDSYIKPELHIESANPQILALSRDLSGNKNVCETVRTFYDFIGDELIYSDNNKNWGAQSTLGTMGADCTEYSSLMIALCRAANIPARYYEGILYLENKYGEVSSATHAWLDVYLPDSGWVAMDPTLGRSSIFRENYFAHYTADHIIVTTGRNPSTLRGSNYWTHLYWQDNNTTIIIEDAGWFITRN